MFAGQFISLLQGPCDSRTGQSVPEADSSCEGKGGVWSCFIMMSSSFRSFYAILSFTFNRLSMGQVTSCRNHMEKSWPTTSLISWRARVDGRSSLFGARWNIWNTTEMITNTNKDPTLHIPHVCKLRVLMIFWFQYTLFQCNLFDLRFQKILS